MGKISIDLSSLKAAGIYTLEIDNSQRTSEDTTESLRMLVGFSNKGPFNRPVLLQADTDRTTVFGDVDTKLEHKGCFFNRMLRTLLAGGPVVALNLLKVDDSYSGPDQVNYAALSLDAATGNPQVASGSIKHGEYDYLSESIDNTVYGTVKGDSIPFVGQTPFASVYNRSRFWTPDAELLTAAAARGLGDSADEGTFEHANLLNFANVGTEEFSILVFKPTNMNGYDVTAESWYGGKENIPFGWIRPYDYISDYFLQVICVKGNWTNYSVLSTDPIWGGYFDKKGILKNKVNQFMSAEGITVLGSWTGIIIPDFVDKQGSNLSLEKKVNAATERTGLLMSFNKDAANILTYDYTGKDYDETDPQSGEWGLDIDGNAEIDETESLANYIVDMCGHGAFTKKEPATVNWENITLDVDTQIDKGWYIKSNTKKPVYTQLDGSIALFIKKDSDISIGVYDNSVLKRYVPVGTYVYKDEIVKSFDPSVDASLYTEAILKSYVVTKYYELGESGSLQAKSATISDVSINEDTSAAEFYYSIGNTDLKVSLTFELDADKKYIVNISNAKREKKIVEDNASKEVYYGINFLSYDYIAEDGDGVTKTITDIKYFSDATIWGNEVPVSEDNKNMFIITAAGQWEDECVKVGDYVRNITFNNKVGETEQYKLIPGLARVTKKQFVQVKDGKVTYKGKSYDYVGKTDVATNKNTGFYLITCVSPVLIEEDQIVRQLPISDDAISKSLRFIPMKGLTLTSRHRPGYDEDGNLDIEAGIEKIYSVLEDQGIYRGLMNPAMVDYRYIIDSMSYGMGAELGGKVYLSKIAYDRGKTTAILNLPSAKQFAVSSNPYFCDTYIPGVNTRPGLNTKYIPEGGNTEMGSTIVFSLPTVDDGASFTACFWPNLIYTENGKTISMPPAADVANVLNRKYTGINDPYCICANQNGILSSKYLTGLEFLADRTDREYLEPFGVNTIIKEQGSYMIYGNQTAYQSIKSDLNKLHVRENLNTAEIECEKVLKRYNFLYNTATTRASIVQQLTPILQAMQLSNALAKYEIICDETNNTAEVIEADTCIVDINLWFNHGMEKIVQKFTINRYASLDD